MGKAITYCNTCQTQIREADFERGTAFRIEDRAYCQKCSGEALKSLPPEKVGALLKQISSSARKSAAAPAPPPSPRIAVAPPAPRKPPVLVVVGAAAGVAVLLILIFSLTWPKATPIEAPVKTTVPEARKPAVDDGAAAFEQLASFAATSTDPEAVLQRCKDARPKLRGTKYEARVEEIEKRAKETWDRNLTDARFAAFLHSVATMRKDDPGFERRAEVRSLIQTAMQTAGTQKPAVEQLLAEYDKSFLEAARAAAEKAKAAAAEFAGQNRLKAALAALEEVTAAFRETEAEKSLAELKTAYASKLAASEKAAAEAARVDAEKRAAAWSSWRIDSGPSEEGLPKLLPRWADRRDVQKLRPPCSLERAIDVPAGKGAVLSLWVGREEGRAGWTMSVTADKKPVATVPVGPDGRIWKPVHLDLSAQAGKKPLLRIDGAAIGSSLEPVYINDLDLRIVGSPAEAAALIAREQDPIAAWTISCSTNGAFLPQFLPEYQGRSRVTMTHPFSQEKPGTLQREVALPAKKKATLSFWVNHAAGADWELRVAVDGAELKRELIGGKVAWRQFSFDLSPHAGKTVKILLQNAANDWSSEFAYWSDIAVSITE